MKLLWCGCDFPVKFVTTSLWIMIISMLHYTLNTISKCLIRHWGIMSNLYSTDQSCLDVSLPVLLVVYTFFCRDLRGVVQEKLLTTQVEVASRDDHLKKVAERQKQAEEQIKRLEAELSEAQKKKEKEVKIRHLCISVYYVPLL